MGVLIGPFSPLQLSFEIINKLLAHNIIDENEAEDILRKSLDPNLSEEEKNKIINSMKK